MRRIALLLLLAAAAGCRRDVPTVLFPRAIIVREDVAAAMAIESDLAKRYDQFAPTTRPWFEALPGKSKVLVVAGHATAHTREGTRKEADAGTGSLAVMLNRLVDCPVIYTTYRSPSDPNYYDDNAFKQQLKQMIDEHKPIIVLDLHASNAGRPYDMDFGTIGGTSLLHRDDLLSRLADNLRREGMRNFSQDYFAASRSGTVTRFVSAMGVPCVQLECNSSWMLSLGARDSMIQQQRFGQLLQALVRFVCSIDGSVPRRSPATTRVGDAVNRAALIDEDGVGVALLALLGDDMAHGAEGLDRVGVLGDELLLH